MLKYFAARLLTFVPTFLGVTLISFAFIRVLPGDPIIVMAGERGLSDERYAELTAALRSFLACTAPLSRVLANSNTRCSV